MNFFRTTDLTWMRGQVKQTLPDTCVIYQPTYTVDGAGRNDVAWNAIGTVSCRIDPGPGIQPEVQGGKESLLNWGILTLEWNVQIGIDHRVVVDGTTYEIRALNNDHSSRVSIKCSIVEIA